MSDSENKSEVEKAMDSLFSDDTDQDAARRIRAKKAKLRRNAAPEKSTVFNNTITDKGVFATALSDHNKDTWNNHADADREKVTLTADNVIAFLPANTHSKIGKKSVDKINNILNDIDCQEDYRRNLLSFGSVMQTGNYSIEEYINAVLYVSYKIRGETNNICFAKTFPDRMTTYIQQGKSDTQIEKFVKAYNRSGLVNQIYEQSMIPTWVLNQSMFQDALNVQADLMRNAKSEKVRSDAANSILTHLKRPEVQEVKVGVEVLQNTALDDLRKATEKLVNGQRQDIINKNSSVQEIAHSVIIENEG